jgi:F-type H+-transporting ATPase subunit b
MGHTLHQLGQLLFDSIPTLLLFVLLHYYLKWMLYKPLRATLAARAQQIEGRQAAAQRLLASAEQKLADYEDKLRARRAENYKLIDARRQQGLTLAQQHLAEARQQSAQAMAQARQKLADETTQAHAQLRGAAEGLAAQIMTQVLRSAGEKAPGVGA